MTPSKNALSDLHAIHASMAMSRIARSIKNLELPLNLTPERLSTLATVRDHGPVTITRIAELEGIGLSTISRIVAALESDGLVSRRDHKADSRSVVIKMTAKGKRTLDQGIRESLRHLSEVLAALDEDMRNALAAVIRDIERLGKRS